MSSSSSEFTISERISACENELSYLHNKEHNLDESFRSLFKLQRTIRGIFSLIKTRYRDEDPILFSQLEDALVAREAFHRRLGSFKKALRTLAAECELNERFEEYDFVVGMKEEVIDMEVDTAEFIGSVGEGIRGAGKRVRELRKLRGGEGEE